MWQVFFARFERFSQNTLNLFCFSTFNENLTSVNDLLGELNIFVIFIIKMQNLFVNY